MVDVSPDAYRLETLALGSSQFGPTKNGAGRSRDSSTGCGRRPSSTRFPGRRTWRSARSRPLGPERTAAFLDYFFPEDVSDGEVEELLAFDDQVGLEDRVLVESVQAGVRSGLIDEGRLMPESERLLAHFQALVREAVA